TILSVYPNPFNDQARVRFDLLKSERVEITLYDLTGRRVRTLADEVCDAGRHEIAFDARGLASGTYFVRLHSSSAVRTQKVLLLK
ncbi:T9SS type A sorting domain-containing protein, partial [bacterium]|nr:T9SS type A sorting domain-containing protein [bacterium]